MRTSSGVKPDILLIDTDKATIFDVRHQKIICPIAVGINTYKITDFLSLSSAVKVRLLSFQDHAVSYEVNEEWFELTEGFWPSRENLIPDSLAGQGHEQDYVEDREKLAEEMKRSFLYGSLALQTRKNMAFFVCKCADEATAADVAKYLTGIKAHSMPELIFRVGKSTKTTSVPPKVVHMVLINKKSVGYEKTHAGKCQLSEVIPLDKLRITALVKEAAVQAAAAEGEIAAAMRSC